MKGLFEFLWYVRQRGLKIRTVYDIGAHVGNWSKAVKAHALHDAEFFLFEANPAYHQDLAKTGFRHFTGCLSNPGRVAVDFYNGTNTGDSYYKENTLVYDQQESIRLPCITLDEFAAIVDLPPPDLIKLDTQGSELDILAGASKAIERASLIYCEVPIINYNKGAPQTGDYLAFFRRLRFVPVGLMEAQHLEHTLVHVDIMFMAEDAKTKFLGPNQNIRPFHDASLPYHPAVAISA